MRMHQDIHRVAAILGLASGMSLERRLGTAWRGSVVGRAVIAGYRNGGRCVGFISVTAVFWDWPSDISHHRTDGEVLTTAELIRAQCLGCDNVHLSPPSI